MIDSDTLRVGERVHELDVYGPEKLLEEPLERLVVVIYTGAHSAVALQLARMGSIRSVPAQDLLTYPLLSSQKSLAEDSPGLACLRAIEKTVIGSILRLRPGDRFAVCGEGELAQVVVDLCLARERRPVVILDDSGAQRQIRSIPIHSIETGIEKFDPESVICAGAGPQDSRAQSRVKARQNERKARRTQLALTNWSQSCESLEQSGLEGTERHIRWTEEREKLWHAAGSFPTTPEDQEKIRSLQNRYRGQRLFVLGNGPSLNRQDLSKLENEYTFCFNKIYLLFDRISWRPTFYTTIDWRVTPDIWSTTSTAWKRRRSSCRNPFVD